MKILNHRITRIKRILWPLRGHRRFSAIIGVTWSDADDFSNNETMKQFNNEAI